MTRKAIAICVALAIALSGIIVGIPPQADAAYLTYYASPTGSGSSCSQAGPCALTTAQGLVRSHTAGMTGDIVVNLAAGTYTLAQTWVFSSTLGDSGTNGHNVIYQSDPANPAGQVPIISGGRTLSGTWTQVDAGKNIWQLPVSNLNTRQLYVNGVRAQRAQGPLPADVTLTQVTGNPPAIDGYTYTASSTNLTSWRNPGDIEFAYYPNDQSISNNDLTWTTPRCGVQSISSSQIIMQSTCWENAATPWADSKGNVIKQDAVPTVENAYEELTRPGQWYWDRSALGGAGALDYIPYPGENPQLETFVAAVLDPLVSGSGALANSLQNIQFSGLAFEYGTWLYPSSPGGFPEVAANVFGVGAYYNAPDYHQQAIGADVAFHIAHNIRFQRDIFAHLGGAGLGFDTGSQNNVVQGNVVTDISGPGIALGLADVSTFPPADSRLLNTGNQVLDNYVYNVAVEYGGGDAIELGYEANSVTAHNEIANTGYIGVHLGWPNYPYGCTNTTLCHDNRIQNNLIYNFAGTTVDGGAIFTHDQQGQSSTQGRSTISGNYIHDSLGTYYNSPLYIDEHTQYLDAYNNVLAAPSTALCGTVVCWFDCHAGSDYLTVHDNYTNVANADVQGVGWLDRGCGSNVSVTNDQGGLSTWPAAAQTIIANAGLESAYQNIKTSWGSPQIVDDSVQGTGTNQFNYVGNWSHCVGIRQCDPPRGSNPSNGYYNNSLSYDNTAGDYVTVQCTNCIQFKFYGAKDPTSGIGAVSVDGGTETSIDFYQSAPEQGNLVLWTSPVLTAGNHTFKLRVTGMHNMSATDYWVDPDRVDIVTSGGATSPVSFNQTSPAAGATGVSTKPTFTWSASSGASSFTLQVATDAGFSHVVINATGLSGTSYTPGTALAANTTYYWRVTAYNSTGYIGAINDPLSFATGGGTVTPVDDSVQGSGNNQFNYVGGGWSHCGVGACPGPGYYQDSISYDKTAGDSVQVQFSGTRITFYGSKCPNCGIAEVWLDGVDKGPLDFYQSVPPPPAYQETGSLQMWDSGVLSAGSHTLKLVVTNTKNASSTDFWINPDRVDITS